jgi:hypothetical protein
VSDPCNCDQALGLRAWVLALLPLRQWAEELLQAANGLTPRRHAKGLAVLRRLQRLEQGRGAPLADDGSCPTDKWEVARDAELSFPVKDDPEQAVNEVRERLADQGFVVREAELQLGLVEGSTTLRHGAVVVRVSLSLSLYMFLLGYFSKAPHVEPPFIRFRTFRS